MTAATMSKSAYAKHRGVGKSAVSNWLRRDQIVLTEDGQVDVAKSDAKLGQQVDPVRGRPVTGAVPTPVPMPATPDSDRESLHSIRARDLQERSIGQALKNALMAGELVPVAAYEAKLATMIGGFCDRMAAELRDKVERLAMETDKRLVRAIVDEVVHTVRSDMASRLSATAADKEE